MKTLISTLAPVVCILIAIAFVEGGLTTDYADARSRMGGRSFKMRPTYKKAPSRTARPAAGQKKGGGSLSRGLMGGLLGGAIGGLLFGSLFGAGGTGMGILPLLLLAAGAYFLFKKLSRPPVQQGHQGYGQPGGRGFDTDIFSGTGGQGAQPPPQGSTDIFSTTVEDGLLQIAENDRDFDANYFKEVASDVFFQVQAGWMRRDLSSYNHLLGEQLASEYEKHFDDLRRKGHINKLESIAIRAVEIIKAGSDGQEDFVTVLFTANLLDYTVDDTSGELVEGSMTDPVKFKEEWTWARPVGTEGWKLEGISD